MIFKIIYQDVLGIQEFIVKAESKAEAISFISPRLKPIQDSRIKEVTEIVESGIVSSKMIKNVLFPGNENVPSAYEIYKAKKERHGPSEFEQHLRKLIDEL